MLTDWLNEECLKHACTFCLRVHATLSHSEQSERKRKRERKREKQRERVGERKKERDVEYGSSVFILKRNDGCLGTF